MTHDLDQLRAVLHDRAALAPSTDDLLPQTRRLVHRRQVRRRVGLVAGVVAVTALALLGTEMFGGLTHNRNADQPTLPLPRPTLPFSVGSVPTGYWLNSWYITDGVASVQYFTGHSDELFAVTWQDFDPAETVQFTTRTPITVQGHPGVLGILQDDGSPQLSWPVDPGHWIMITEPKLGHANVSAIADSITQQPTTLPAALRIASVPDNLVVTIWQGDLQPTSQDAEVILCPPGTPPTGVEPPAPCTLIHEGTGAAPSKPFQGPGSIISADSKPVVMTPRNRMPVISDNGRVVTRQVDSTHWVAATSAFASTALILRLVKAAG